MRTIRILGIACLCLYACMVDAKVKVKSITVNSVTISTNSSAQNDLVRDDNRAGFVLSSQGNRIKFKFPDGKTFYVTNISEWSLPTGPGTNVLGIPNSHTINMILGGSGLSYFDVYNDEDLLIFRVHPTYSEFFRSNSNESTPMIQFLYSGRMLRIYHGDGRFEIESNGSFSGGVGPDLISIGKPVKLTRPKNVVTPSLLCLPAQR